MRRAPPGEAPPIWVGARPLPEASASIGGTLALVRRKLPFLAIWVAAFVAFGAIYSKIVRQDFIATTQILLQPRVIVNEGPEDLRHFHQFMIDGDQCETELRVLRSEQLLYRVFKALDLGKSPEIRNGPDGFWSYLGARIDQVEDIVSPGHESLKAFYAFADRVRSRRLGLSYVIEISYRAQSAEQAARVVNAIASAYAVYRLRGALARIQRQGVYLEARLAKLQQQMMIADAGMRFGAVPDAALPDADRPRYAAFVLPGVRADQVEGLTQTAEVQRQQRQRRKAATDAVVPQFAAIRAEAHLRHNRLRRLRQAVHGALRELERPEPPAWPIAFRYD